MAFLNMAFKLPKPGPDSNLYGLHRRLKDLQCPFNWEIVIGGGLQFDYYLREEEDRIHRKPLPWSKVISKLALTYQYHLKGHHAKSKQLLVECYIPLIEEEMYENGCGCELIKKHKVALKHVLDATWAHIRAQLNYLTHLDNFVDEITQHSSMSPQENAAIYSIRAQIDQATGKLDHAHIATLLDPTEGQWHYYLGRHAYNQLHQSHEGPLSGMLDSVKKSAQTAYNLRINPETIIFFASVLREDDELNKAAKLFRQAINLYPDSVYTNLECGMVFYMYPPPVQDFQAAKHCLKKALTLAKECLEVHLIYGKYLLFCGRPQEAVVHLKTAVPVYRDAIATMQHLEHPAGPPNCAQQ